MFSMIFFMHAILNSFLFELGLFANRDARFRKSPELLFKSSSFVCVQVL
jgi:hypothetical protein